MAQDRNTTVQATSTVVDAAGRLVVPAQFRAALGFRTR